MFQEKTFTKILTIGLAFSFVDAIRGHPLSNYAKGRGEGGIKMRNNA